MAAPLARMGGARCRNVKVGGNTGPEEAVSFFSSRWWGRKSATLPVRKTDGNVLWYHNITVLGYGHAYPPLEFPFASDAKPNHDKMIGLEVMKHSVAFGKFHDGQAHLSMKWEKLAEPRPQMCRGEGYQDAWVIFPRMLLVWQISKPSFEKHQRCCCG